MAVSDYERKIDALRKDNEYYWEELHDLQMENDGKEEKKIDKKDTELAELDAKISLLKKELNNVQQM